MTAAQSLTLIKFAHTGIWAVMAAAIVAIPIAALRGRFRAAGWLSALIAVECLVLALNSGHCPLTDLAARFTTDRAPNFDIYLPCWLAQHNKSIFGGIFIAGEFTWLWRWTMRPNKNAIPEDLSAAAQKNGATRR
jgi:hypothetical protein